MTTDNDSSTKRATATCWSLVIGLAIGAMSFASGCVAGESEGSGDPRAPSTEVAEQASRIQWCDTQYLDAGGRIIGQCILPCRGALQCTGTTSGPSVASIESSCERCQ